MSTILFVTFASTDIYKLFNQSSIFQLSSTSDVKYLYIVISLECFVKRGIVQNCLGDGRHHKLLCGIVAKAIVDLILILKHKEPGTKNLEIQSKVPPLLRKKSHWWLYNSMFHKLFIFKSI